MTTADKLVKGGISAETAKVIIGDVDSGVTATGSSSQSDSYAVRAHLTDVSGGGATTGVRLPAANGGDNFTICNRSASNCLVYPPTGGKLNDGSANAAITLADNESATFHCINTIDYMAVIGSAS